MSIRSRSLVLTLLTGFLVAACSLDGGGSPPPSAAPGASATATPAGGSSALASPVGSPSGSAPSGSATVLHVGLGYIPSVQFAPFYLADQRGYYRDAGLDVTFRHGTDYDVIALVGQGELDLGLADGTSVIPAVSQGIPLKYVATIYGTFPSIVFAKASSGIRTAADLKGRKLGIPGRYGSSWIMLQALLDSVGLKPSDLDIVDYPDYGQGAAVAVGAVDAATGFANNEPVQLELQGTPATVLHVDDVVPLPGNGLITSDATLGSKRDAIKAFIAATLRAMDEIAADPAVGLEASIAAVPDLAAARDQQRAVLDATIEVWKHPGQSSGSFGTIVPADWDASIAYLTKLGLVPTPVTSADMLDTGLLPSGG